MLNKVIETLAVLVLGAIVGMVLGGWVLVLVAVALWDYTVLDSYLMPMVRGGAVVGLVWAVAVMYRDARLERRRWGGYTY
jgi:hypothetical protein